MTRSKQRFDYKWILQKTDLHLKALRPLTWRDLILTAIPLVLWLSALQLRPHVIERYCMSQPELCERKHLIWPDSIVPDFKSLEAHRWSNFTQVVSGVVPFAGLVGMNFLLKTPFPPQMAFVRFGTDLVICLQAVFWNGFLTESTKLMTQRLRPHSYLQPEIDGENHAHYTSFYSGHTSFSAVATMIFFLILCARQVSPAWLFRFWAPLLLSLTISTGLLRIFGGRHFFSDVVAGAIAGWSVALLVFWIHQQPKGAR